MARGTKAAAPKGKRPGGRPSLYKVEYPAQAEKLCKLGAVDTELADFFGVALSTLNKWKLDHPEFSESLKRGKILADAEVADKLFHRATGYKHEAVKILVVAGSVERVPYVEHYPPDTTAAIFWLKNRQPAKWRDKPPEAGEDEDEVPKSVAVTVKDARKPDEPDA